MKKLQWCLRLSTRIKKIDGDGGTSATASALCQIVTVAIAHVRRCAPCFRYRLKLIAGRNGCGKLREVIESSTRAALFVSDISKEGSYSELSGCLSMVRSLRSPKTDHSYQKMPFLLFSLILPNTFQNRCRKELKDRNLSDQVLPKLK